MMGSGETPMNRSLTIVLGLIAGLTGGLLTRYIAPPAAFAQNQTPVTKELRAQRFTLVDGLGSAVGTFMVEGEFPSLPDASNSTPDPNTDLARRLRAEVQRRNGPPRRIVLVDPNGREIWSAGGSLVRPLSANVR
jgi:hypothetical protein